MLYYINSKVNHAFSFIVLIIIIMENSEKIIRNTYLTELDPKMEKN